MKNVHLHQLGILGATLLAAVVVSAQEPVRNIDPNRHPNLATAQTLVVQAFDKLTAAQKANEFDLGGHAQRAKSLLTQANDEIKQAAAAANRN